MQAIDARKASSDTFWERDLSQIESDFLGKRKITELPFSSSDGRVPMSGSVLEDFVDADAVVIQPSIWLVRKEKLRRLLFK